MNVKKILVLSLFTIAIVGIVAPTYASNVDETNMDSAKVLTKTKTVINKITYNANGGKIDKKTSVSKNVKLGSKLGTLASTPKRSGYTFQGWYTKKSGGTKISKNTKPNKSVTYYAHWKSKMANVDSKLIGKWYAYKPLSQLSIDNMIYYTFDNNGRFSYMINTQIKIGNYKVSPAKINYPEGFYYKTQLSSGKITFTNVKYNNQFGEVEKYPDTVVEYRVVKDSKGDEVLEIPMLDYPNLNYLSYSEFFHRFAKASS